MSELSSKLERTPATEGRARRKLSSLKEAMGYVVLRTRDGQAELVRIDHISGTWAWQRTAPGADALFEWVYERGGNED